MALGESFDSVLQAARLGADWAVVVLYRDRHPHVLAYLRSRCPDEAEDLGQEAWIDVSRGIARFEGGETAFRRFVFTVARRRMIDHVRLLTREGRTSRLNEDLADTVPGGDVEQIAISRLTADEAVA